MVRTSYLLFAYCLGQSVVVHGGFTRSCGMCTPLQSRSIQNSRVLGYGQLNGHVASIVSMFSKRMFCFQKMMLYLGGTRKGTMYLWGTDDEKPKVVSTRSFAKKNLLYSKWSLIKTLLICDIYKRNYTYLLKYLFQQRYRDVINHDESFIYHG